MDSGRGGQGADVTAPAASMPTPASRALELEAVYRDHAAFCWRMARRLGAPDEATDDIVHDVFLVVRRRLPDFDASRPVRPWLFGIVRRVVADLRRGRRRAEGRIRLVPTPPEPVDPEQQAQRNAAADFVRTFLDELPPSQRMVFVMMELEGMTAPETAEALGAELPTVYSRLRLARGKFERAVARRQAQDRRDRGGGR
jgi:RNA polymerase sigma-70 factor (ECF subfamily)